MSSFSFANRILLPTIVLFAASIFAGNTASASSLMFTLGGTDNFGTDPIQVDVTIEEMGDDLKFTVTLVPDTIDGTNNIGDIRGIFFDVSDDSIINTLSVTGADVTDSEFQANSVINFGGGNNLNPADPFDAGLTIGTPGMGNDDIQTTMFVLSSSTTVLTLDFVNNERLGVRATSVGPANSGREGSSKIAGIVFVPEPSTLALSGIAGIAGLGLALRRRARG